MVYDQKLMDEYANSIETYLDYFDNLVIKEGLKKDEYEKNKKIVEDLIKKLRKGEGDKVFNKERYLELMDKLDEDGDDY